MTYRDLSGLFAPREIAIIGASDRAPYTRSVFANLRDFGFPLERVHLVNRKQTTVFGRAAVPSLADIGSPVDVAYVGSGAGSVLDVVDQCGKLGVKGCVVLTDGFSESGAEGGALQRRVIDLARSNGTLLCGPNTLGFASIGRGVPLWGRPLPEVVAGNVSGVFQSGGVGGGFLELASGRGLGMNTIVATGNQADLDSVEYINHLVDDPGTDVIAAHVESLERVVEMAAVVRRASLASKPVVLLLVGTSEVGRRNAAAHTGVLSAPGPVMRMLLEDAGAIVVDDIDELCETVALLGHVASSRAVDCLRGADSGVGLVTVSGGECTLLADAAGRSGTPLTAITVDERTAVREALGRPSVVGNPMDVGNSPRKNPEGFERGVRMMAKLPNTALLASRLPMSDPPEPWLMDAYRAVARIAREEGKPAVFLSRTITAVPPQLDEFFRTEPGVVLLRSYHFGMRAMAGLRRFGRWLDEQHGESPWPAAVAAAAHPPATPPPTVVPYQTVRRLLSDYGVAVPAEEYARTGPEAAAAAERLGFPVVVKIDSVDLPHKTEVGGVAVGLECAADVLAACERQQADVARLAPHARLAGWVVQKMVGGVAEVLVGATTVAKVGKVLTIGSGGVLTELAEDVRFLLAPASPAEVRRALSKLGAAALLRGYRGAEPADVDSLVALVVAFGRLVHEHSDELDVAELNPVIVGEAGSGAVAVDALLIRAGSGREGRDE
ncbi:acetate--CoA ligase family protein [Actinophytocola sp.]|uniref:acetate--CoA ligase family protein n=1 Tax=Actinophytocola sp. TaxID=1872138 RepID=UPI0025BB603B|nr:acetate--CoA ligase family protein [Actinophytocola sp.]